MHVFFWRKVGKFFEGADVMALICIAMLKGKVG